MKMYEKLICAFVFAYAKCCLFVFQEAAQIFVGEIFFLYLLYLEFLNYAKTSLHFYDDLRVDLHSKDE